MGCREQRLDQAHCGNLMTSGADHETTHVVGNHVVLIAQDDRDLPCSLEVTVQLDGRRLPSYEEPGWRPLGYGVVDHLFCWWSARRLVSLLTDATPLLLDQLDAGEDILLVFRAQNRWLFVCETSLRLVRDNKEVSPLDFPDVIIEATSTALSFWCATPPTW